MFTLTDFVQVFLIVIGMALAIPFALNMIGGWDNVVGNIPADHLSFTSGVGIKGIIGLVIMYTASFTVSQEAVCRYYAARDDKAAKQGSLIACGINILYAFIPYILGHYYKKASKAGAISSLIVGSVVSLLVERKIIPFFGLDPIIPGLIFSAIVFFIFCKLYPPKDETVEFLE